MPLFKVWSEDKLNKKFIVAENFTELVSRADLTCVHAWRVGDLTLFEALTGGAFDRLTGNIAGNLTKIFQKSHMPQGLPGGGGWVVLELTGTLGAPESNDQKQVSFCMFNLYFLKDFSSICDTKSQFTLSKSNGLVYKPHLRILAQNLSKKVRLIHESFTVLILFRDCQLMYLYVSVTSKLQHPPPRAYPGHLTSFPAREKGIWLTH